LIDDGLVGSLGRGILYHVLVTGDKTLIARDDVFFDAGERGRSLFLLSPSKDQGAVRNKENLVGESD
jgi:hypothetical protein